LIPVKPDGDGPPAPALRQVFQGLPVPKTMMPDSAVLDPRTGAEASPGAA